VNSERAFAALAEALAGPLPGDAVKQAMWPASFTGPRRPAPGQDVASAAVLILLFEQDGQACFPLMRRTQVEGDVHSGQISLPGGRIEPGETAQRAALRETHEEIGVPPDRVHVIGRLSSHWIPVSGYEVTPFIGISHDPPRFVPDEVEVESVLVTSVQELRSPRRRSTFARDFADRGRVDVPCWRLDEGILWGATAMILTEFLALWDRLPPAVRE
jgi:8-oxo-dGTP pyrophosphatase MutT (NUDIX family)